MKNVSLARLTLSLMSCTWSSGSSCKSCRECPGVQKCSATPDVSVRLFIMSRRCSLNLSLVRRPVCPMYWQSVFLSCRHCLNCSKYMTLVELQSRLCRMSKVLFVFKNISNLFTFYHCKHPRIRRATLVSCPFLLRFKYKYLPIYLPNFSSILEMQVPY